MAVRVRVGLAVRFFLTLVSQVKPRQSLNIDPRRQTKDFLQKLYGFSLTRKNGTLIASSTCATLALAYANPNPSRKEVYSMKRNMKHIYALAAYAASKIDHGIHLPAVL